MGETEALKFEVAGQMDFLLKLIKKPPTASKT
jgi:hypothetical protein